MPVQTDLLHLNIYKLDFSELDFLARCCALKQHLNTQDEDWKDIGCNTCLEKNSILPYMKPWFKMALQHTVRSPAALRALQFRTGVRAPVCSEPPPDCQDRADTLALLNPCELKVHTTHTCKGYDQGRVVQPMKCIHGLPNTIYAQNRALILH